MRRQEPILSPLSISTLLAPRTPVASRTSTQEPVESTPLVLLHGFTGDASTWAPLVAALGHQRPILAVDLVGHGGSPAPSDPRAYQMNAVLASLQLALEAKLGPSARPHLLGYSMGGRVALSLAERAPARCSSLTLVGATPGIADARQRAERRQRDAALSRSIEEDGLEAFVGRWMANPLFATQAALGPDYLARARDQRLRCRPEALAHTLRELGTGSMPSLWDRLPQIETPCLLVAGALDPKFEALATAMADASTGLANARVAIIEGAGHAVQVEAPAALARTLEAFLETLD